MSPSTVFFDAGYTLLRADPSLGDIYASVTREFGVIVPAETFERAFGPMWERRVAESRRDPELLREDDALNRDMWRGFTEELQERIPGLDLPFDPWFERLYGRFGETASWRPFPEAEGVLTDLRGRGYRLAVLSNWDSRLLGILEGLGLSPHFEEIVVSSRVGYRKPHPEIFRAACARMGARPAEALHVGDSLYDDVEGARASGLEAVLVCRGGDPPRGVRAVRSLSDLTRRGGILSAEAP